MNITHKKILLFCLALLALYAGGLFARRAVLDVQIRAVNGEMPFTLESALNFRRIEQIVKGGVLPDKDPYIQYPDGIHISETDTVGDAYVYAALSRLFPSGVTLTNRLRWIEPAWFCLGIPFMALWLWWWRRSVWAALIGSAFYAFAISSVIRSTGQELSHENFALPLLIGHLALGALARGSKIQWRTLAANIGSALLLGAALMTWDLIQFYVFLWMIFCFVEAARVGFKNIGGMGWLIHWVVLMLCGLLNPYLSVHGFVRSPPMLFSYGILISGGIAWAGAKGLSGEWSRRRGVLILIALLPLLASFVIPGEYAQAYGHFRELLIAKIRFVNQKPADPSLLTFSQRIMWVPALNSATRRLTWILFPAILPMSLIAALVFLFRSGKRSDSRIFQLLFFYIASLIAYVLFVRFHVFVAIFSAALLGLLASWASKAGYIKKWLILVILIFGLGVEARNTLKDAERWGRGWVYYDELKQLSIWLNENTAPDPVLANFGVSGTILTYGGCPIVLHPKFESKLIRQRVREYGEGLFKGKEKDFRDWADRLGAEYYVYSLGEFVNIAPDQQMRYFVDALEPPEDCPARMFEFAPESGRYFRYLWGNRKYRVFSILTRNDERMAEDYARKAMDALSAGDLDAAEYLAVESSLLDSKNTDAQKILKHVGALKDQGFKQPDGDGEK